MKLPVPLRRLLLPLALALAAVPARATWSIVALDRATGEVVVASATCLADFNLIRYTPVIVVGQGAGAAQSFIDTSGNNRQRMFDGLEQGLPPAEILDQLDFFDPSHQTRQYGIVGLGGPPVTFTGSSAGLAATGVTGRVGTIEYAIQGNVLAGDEVVFACEDAFVHAGGDLAGRAMAAMEAARAFGGDGRCSCPGGPPTACGAPPPSFDKSAHTAFIVVARPGDVDGTCDTQAGCASGEYYLKRRAVGGVADPEPLIELERRYARWREIKAAFADHYLTRVVSGATRLPADGSTSTTVTLELVNLEGVALGSGGQTVVVTDLSGGAPVALAGPVTDHGDGTHSFELTATTTPGSGRWRIEVVDGTTTVRLFPDLELAVDPALDLHCGLDAIGAAAGGVVPFTIDRGAAEAGRPYRLLASASGTAPGTSIGPLTLPLNADRVLAWSLVAGPPLLVDGFGLLDAGGRALPRLAAPPGLLAPLVGTRLDFCCLLGSGPDEHTAVAGLEVLP